MTIRGTNTDGSVSPTLPPAQVATAILTLAAAGQPVPEVLLAMLADGVLSAPLPRLALEVRAGGEHQLGRAIELAEAVLQGIEGDLPVPKADTATQSRLLAGPEAL